VSQEKFPLSLPGYPFDKRLCWAGAVQAAPAGTLRSEATDLQTTQPAEVQRVEVQRVEVQRVDVQQIIDVQQAASQQITQQLTGML
ncbi:hypothetical protein, partial [Dickeya dianthicola]|uniref:hypothetical protein n=1 Tax=Dickeya dianthicola TaxID=204039 RepID=UPI00128FAE5B